MKVTLIYPGITKCGFNFPRGDEGSWIHHGLAVLSSCLKKSGHEVDLIDLRRLSGWDEFRQVVERSSSRAVGITMMSVDFNTATTAARIWKELKPDHPVIVGGAHPSICPEELEGLDCYDHIVKGEGESLFPKLLDELERGQNCPRFIECERPENLDEIPWADRDLFQTPEEPFVAFLPSPFVTVIAGRGCRYNCNFCQPAERIMFGPSVRRRSVKNVVGELKYLRERFDFNSYLIHDDCITEDRQWVLDFCREVRAEGFDQPFLGQSRSDIICRHRDMIEALYNAGLRLLMIGFESGSDRVLKFLRKGCTRKQNLEAARICREIGIKVWANYMLGLPTETREEVMETVSMLEEMRPYRCSPAFYTPHPGSDLFNMGKELGIHVMVNPDLYRRNNYEEKILGPDYDFLRDVLHRSLALGEKMPSAESAARYYGQICKNTLMRRFPRLYKSLRIIKRKSLRVSGIICRRS